MTGPAKSPDAQAVRTLRLQLVTAEQHLKDSLNGVSKALQTLDCDALEMLDQDVPADQTVALMRARRARSAFQD